MTGRVMLLNGAPSAGKTTLAKAVQAASEGPLFHRSLDDFLAGVPRGFRERDDGTLFERVMVGYLHSLASLARAGVDVVAEAVIIPERRALYAEAFAGIPVILVGVRCSLAVAQERERIRTDRTPLELDVPWFETVHDLAYDAEVETDTGVPVDELAARLVELYAAGLTNRPAAAFSLIARSPPSSDTVN